MLKSLIRPLCAAGFLLCAAVPAAASNPYPMLECRLSLPKTVALGQPVPLDFALSNPGRKLLWVLAWNTPLEGLRNRFLRVTGPAGEIGYRGPMFKRGEPTAEHYRRVPAGGAIHGEIDLALAYAFDRPGRYTVEFTGGLHDVIVAPARPPRTLAQLRAQPLPCSAAEVEVLAP